MNAPRDLMEIEWFRIAATRQPGLVPDRVRPQPDHHRLGHAGARARLRCRDRARRDRDRGRVLGARSSDGADMRLWPVASGRRVADAEKRAHDPVAPRPVAHVPALLLRRVRRRARPGRERARGSTTAATTRRSSSCSCCCSRRRSAACSRGSASRATSRAASPSVSSSPLPDAAGIVLGYGIAAAGEMADHGHDADGHRARHGHGGRRVRAGDRRPLHAGAAHQHGRVRVVGRHRDALSHDAGRAH